MNQLGQKVCLWSGVVMMALFAIGFILLAEYIPPPAATLSPEELAQLWSDNLSGFRWGLTIMTISLALLVSWGAGVAARVRQSEGDFPALSFGLLASAPICSLIGQAPAWFWLAGAYRIGEIPATTAVALHDVGWFFLIGAFPSFSVWTLLMGVAIIADKRPQPDFPRWVAYLSFWVTILLAPACMIFWFKSGPFAWNGLLAFYVPIVSYFVWMATVTYYAIKSITPDGAKAPAQRSAERVPTPTA